MVRHLAWSFAVVLLAMAVPDAAVAQTAGPAQYVPAERTFRDWVVGCDNVRGCIALGLSPADGAETAFLYLQRDAGRGAQPTVSLVLYTESETPGDRQIHLTIDGATIEGVASRRLAEAGLDVLFVCFNRLLARITEPALRPIRRIIPNLGGIDLSPVVLILLLKPYGLFGTRNIERI